jgi:hypothetical protein
MTTYVLEMSTDPEILNTALHPNWPQPWRRHQWAAVSAGGLNIPNNDIVVIAHGAPTEIGNHDAGTVDITPDQFVQHIAANMAVGAVPSHIYISVCQTTHANFAALVHFAIERQRAAGTLLWASTPPVSGHSNSISGRIPVSTGVEWAHVLP